MNNDLLQQLQQSNSDVQTTWIVTNAMLQTLQPEVAEAVLAAAVPHWFNQPILAALLAVDFDQAASLYQIIQQLSFTERFGHLGCALHERTRIAILTHLTTVLPAQFLRYSQYAYTYFNTIDDLQHRVEATYHLLVIDETQGLARFKTYMQQYRDHSDFSAANNLLRNAQELITLNRFVEETEAEIDRQNYLMGWKRVQLGQSDTEPSNAKMHLKQAIRFFQPEVDLKHYESLNLAQLRDSVTTLQQDFLKDKWEDAVLGGKPSHQKVWLNELVDLAHNQTDYESALQRCNDALDRHPDDSKLITQRGKIYRLMKRYQEALADFNHTIDLNPNDATIYRNRGDLYKDLQDYPAALVDYSRAIAIDPHNAEVYANRGQIYYELQNYEAALADHDHAITIEANLAQVYNNRGITYYALQDYPAALADYNQALTLDPNYAKAYNNRGITYKALQNYSAALADYTHAISLEPTYAQAYNNRGVTYKALQNYSAALVDYTHAIALKPIYAQAYYNRGNTYADLQDYTAALADYTHTLALDPNYAQAYHNRGNVHRRLQNYAAALADYNQAIILDPTYATAYCERGLIYAELQQPAAALADYNQAITLDPTYATAYYNRGVTYTDLENYPAALADYNTALALDPSDAQAYYNRGNIHNALQNSTAALADYNTALALNPNDAQVYFNRGLTYADLENYPAALADYNTALALDPKDAQVYLHIGSLLGNQGRLQEALLYFEQATQLGEPQGARYVAQTRQMLGMEPTPSLDPIKEAFAAFQQTDSIEAMQHLAAPDRQHPKEHTMTPQPRYQPGDRIGGRYQVHKALMGGMGEVYLCLDLEERLPYALKTFQQRYLTDSQRLRKAFEQEVATWVALEKHPNIVRCFYMDTLDRQPFMVLEWIAGEEGRGTDLRGWLRRGPLDLKLALQIALDICRGLIHAQTKRPGLVHRDLKPENILIAQGGLAKITDFGLAEFAQSAGLTLDLPASTGDGRHSMVGGQRIVGTPTYMAPEQWRGEHLDERTDIYALGVILYELLTGHPPFVVTLSSTTPQSVQTWLHTLQHAHEQAPVMPLPSGLPAELNDLLQRCLAKAPTARHAHVADLLNHVTDIYHAAFQKPPRPQPVLETFTATDYNNRGVTYATLGQQAAALTDYTQAITLDPTFAQVYVNRGATYTDLDQYETALADFAHAIHLDPYYAQVYVNRSVTYTKLGHYEAALADHTHALSIDPNLAHAYLNRGNTYQELGQHDAAIADYTHSISIDPNLAQAYNNRGNTYQELRQHDVALVDFNRAISLDPNYAEAYYNRGITYKTLGEYEAALADYTHTLQINSNFAQAYANRASIYQLYERREDALADLNRALTLDPNLATVYVNRGLAYAELGQHETALTDYAKALALDPTDAQTYYNRGVTYLALRKYEAALADYNLAIEIDPNYAKAYCNRGTAHWMLEEYPQALDDYGQAIALNASYADAYFAMGFLLVKLGQAREALYYLEKATQLGHSKAAQTLEQVNQELEHEPPAQVDPIQLAFEVFQQADSLAAMEQAVARFPLLVQSDFISLLAQIISEQIPRADRPAFEKRLGWLRQVANDQKPGFFSRLFNRGGK